MLIRLFRKERKNEEVAGVRAGDAKEAVSVGAEGKVKAREATGEKKKGSGRDGLRRGDGSWLLPGGYALRTM